MTERKGASPIKRRYFTAIGSSSVKMVADKQKNAAYHNNLSTGDELLRNVNIDDLE